MLRLQDGVEMLIRLEGSRAVHLAQGDGECMRSEGDVRTVVEGVRGLSCDVECTRSER